MSPVVYRIRTLLSQVLEDVPLGTNLALFTLLWMLLSGRLLQSRGAVIPALADLGLPADAVRRAWAALAYGRWTLQPLLDRWQALVQAEGRWQPHVYGGLRPVACDLVGLFRPRLQHCPTKHYSSAAGKALPAIPFGVVVAVGSVGSQRLPLPRQVLRATPEEDPSETALQRRLLQLVAHTLAADEALVSDRGFPLADVLAAKQVIGAQRQFVFAAESRQRLPELAFLAGSILTYAAATAPAVRTGFWDRAAQPTCGRLRRLLARVHFADLEGLPGHFRKKATVTDHLPKGILGHRRQPASPPPQPGVPRAPCFA
jgi:hypothetical protein